MSRLNDWALAVQKHEGYYAGSRSFRNNNPGNLRYTSYTATLGENNGKDDKRFIIYKTYEIGFNALKQFLKDAATDELRSYKSSMNLLEFYSVYAPSADGNSPKNYSNFIANALNVPVSTKISELIQEETEPVPTEIHIENQLDSKWSGHYLGKSKSSYNAFACKLFALTYLYSVKSGTQISPDEVNELLYKGGAYFNGDMLEDNACAKVLGFDFLGKETDINKAPAWSPTIKEVDFSIKAGKQQHFVVRCVDSTGKYILDPYEGVRRKINYYEQKVGAPNWEGKRFSYRKFKIK